MADIKKYYYLKLKDNFFDLQEIKVLESMPNGVYYSNMLIKLYLRCLKSDGVLRINDCISFDEKMIATITGVKMSIVKKGMSILTKMGFITRGQDGTIYMRDIQNFIGKSNSEADRKKMSRQMSAKCPDKSEVEGGANGEVFLDKRPPEIERDKELELKLELELDNRDREIGTRAIEKENTDNITSLSVSLLKNFQDRTGTVGSLNLGALKKAVELHGVDHVQRAIDKALEKNKPTMTYINGILKNWASEGYPKEGEQVGNGSSGKNNGAGSNEFAGFKPKDPRNLSDEERAALEIELL